MPPVMMFIRKQRPKGLEFPSCRKCNNGTSKSDLVASLVGRLSVDPSADVEAAEITKLFSSGLRLSATPTKRPRSRRSRNFKSLRISFCWQYFWGNWPVE